MLAALRLIIALALAIAIIGGLIYVWSFLLIGVLAIGAAALVGGLAIFIASFIWKAVSPQSRESDG